MHERKMSMQKYSSRLSYVSLSESMDNEDNLRQSRTFMEDISQRCTDTSLKKYLHIQNDLSPLKNMKKFLSPNKNKSNLSMMSLEPIEETYYQDTIIESLDYSKRK